MGARLKAQHDHEFERRVAQAREAALRDIHSLARELVPKGCRSGASWQGRPPYRDSDNDKAFAIYLNGPKAGGWKDFVSGETGDIFDLLMKVKAIDQFIDALRWLEGRYGLAHLSAEERERLNKNQAVLVKAREGKEQAGLLQKRLRACKIFGEAEKNIQGTAVESYWRARGIELAQLPHLEQRWLRAAKLSYPFSDRKIFFPCQLAAFVNAQGVMQALHVTYLAADGSGKAPVDRPKLMYAAMKGSMIRINKGASGLDPEEAVAAGVAGPLVICEGVEDALSIAALEPSLRVWAAGSLSNYLEIPNHDCASSFIIARDNDWGKVEPARLFERALKRLQGFGKPVRVVRSCVGKDFNDLIRRDKDVHGATTN